MSQPLDVIIVERLGSLKLLSVKDFKLEELYKKCGFKKAEDFVKQTEWNLKYDGKKYYIQVYGKIDGRANSENKYDFPPPIDNKLFYGSCAIIGQIRKDDGSRMYTNLSIPIWDKIYEKLFGGFEDLSASAKEDEEEEDELENIPKERKTKEGYLKDGFVVDGSDDDDDSEYITSEDDDDDDNDNEDDDNNGNSNENSELELEDIGSELSEESYDYDDKKVGK
jgi:hypothetical protein